MGTNLKAAVALVVADTREQYDEDFPNEVAIQLCLDALTLDDYVRDLGPEQRTLQVAYELVFQASPDELGSALRGLCSGCAAAARAQDVIS